MESILMTKVQPPTCGIRNLSCHDFRKAKMRAMVPERLDAYIQAPTSDIDYADRPIEC